MATFRRGDRVKRVASGPYSIPLGTTGTIRRGNYEDGLYNVSCVDVDWDVPGLEEWAVAPQTLAPLTPPDESAERFIESLKKLAREPLPLTKEKA